jgi:sulfur-oxidizing protein SoxZ
MEGDMSDPMKIRATMAGDKVEVKVLMSHEMETGQRKDAKGAVIPAWFIRTIATLTGARTFSADGVRQCRRTRSFRSSCGRPADKVDSPGRQLRRETHRRSDHRLISERLDDAHPEILRPQSSRMRPSAPSRQPGSDQGRLPPLRPACAAMGCATCATT